MEVAIYSFVNDIHAIAVDWALKRKNIASRLICVSDFPDLLMCSFRIDDQGFSHAITEPENVAPLASARVVWHRRNAPFQMPLNSHPSDHKIIEKQGKRFLELIKMNSFPDSFWINSFPAQQGANDKLYQLRTAKEVGIKIPQTLVSNNPADIRRFVEGNIHVIAKPFSNVSWNGEGYSAGLYTSKVEPGFCNDDNPLKWQPMIYQKLIEKSFELRIVVMGQSIFCAKIDSQNASGGEIDWRIVQNSNSLNMSHYELDEANKAKILKFMAQMGLVFGSLDVIIEPNGDMVFLEINEQGQFLFLEERVSGMHLLDAFSDFCISASPDFVYSKKAPEVLLSEFVKSDEWRIKQDDRINLHREYTLTFSVTETERYMA